VEGRGAEETRWIEEANHIPEKGGTDEEKSEIEFNYRQ